MVVPTETWRRNYTGDGATTAYVYNWKMASEQDAGVWVTDSENATTQLRLNIDYTVTGVKEQSGGTVVFYNAPADGSKISILHWPKFLQLHGYDQYGIVREPSHEGGLDKLQAQIHRLADQISRIMQAQEADKLANLLLPDADERAGKVIRFDEDGNLIVEESAT